MDFAQATWRCRATEALPWRFLCGTLHIRTQHRYTRHESPWMGMCGTAHRARSRWLALRSYRSPALRLRLLCRHPGSCVGASASRRPHRASAPIHVPWAGLSLSMRLGKSSEPERQPSTPSLERLSAGIRRLPRSVPRHDGRCTVLVDEKRRSERLEGHSARGRAQSSHHARKQASTGSCTRARTYGPMLPR